VDYNLMTLSEVTKLPGVADLQPLRCRAAFAKALKLEAEGKHKEAEEQLSIAVAAEAR